MTKQTNSKKTKKLNAIQTLLQKHQKEFQTLPNGKIKCILTGHEFLPTQENLTNHLNSKSFKKATEALFDITEYQDVLSTHKQNSNFLYCRLTGSKIPKKKTAVEKHVNGRRFQIRFEQYKSKVQNQDGQQLIDPENQQEEQIQEEIEQEVPQVKQKVQKQPYNKGKKIQEKSGQAKFLQTKIQQAKPQTKNPLIKNRQIKTESVKTGLVKTDEVKAVLVKAVQVKTVQVKTAVQLKKSPQNGNIKKRPYNGNSKNKNGQKGKSQQKSGQQNGNKGKKIQKSKNKPQFNKK